MPSFYPAPESESIRPEARPPLPETKRRPVFEPPFPFQYVSDTPCLHY